MVSEPPRLALIGFGEAGSTFARAGRWGANARGYDILDERRTAMLRCGITPCDTAQEALAGVEMALSLVTADAALNVARDCAPALAPGALWCDMNSVAPETKRAGAVAVEEHGGRYVDVAVMAPVEPAALAVPLLLSGPAAEDAQGLLAAAGFTNMRIVGEEIGRASAIKMIRSVMVKGLEALSWECAAAADVAGVFEEVMASLDASERQTGWADRIAYNRERMGSHGARRATEMEEAAKTLLDLGIEPIMTRGTVVLQRRAAKANDKSDRNQAA